MSTESTSAKPWDQPEYGRITSAQMDDLEFVVSFADGTSARLDPRPLLPRNAKDEDIDWWRVASNSMEVIVPIADTWFKIPWDVIRLRTDPEFDAHWERLTTKVPRSDKHSRTA